MHDGKKNYQLIFIQGQRLGNEFFSVIILHVVDCIAQQLKCVQALQAAHGKPGELSNLSEQQAVRQLQVGQLQLLEPLGTTLSIFKNGIGAVVSRFERQGQHG